MRETLLMPAQVVGARALTPASAVLQRLHDDVPSDHFTLVWLMDNLQKRCFGLIILLLALVALAPGLSIVAGVLLVIAACQMIAGRPAPVFPRRIATYPLPTRRLASLVQRSLPGIRVLETVIHPRWQTPAEGTARVVGAAVALLSVTLIFIPIPFSNIIPALVIALISLAYIEEDGVLLSIGLLAATVVLAVAMVAVWKMVSGAQWIVDLW